MLTIQAANAARAITGVSVRVGGVLRPVTVKVMRANTLIQVWPPRTSYTASASPETLIAAFPGYRPRKAASQNATVTPNGGTAPYRYWWAVAGDDRVNVTSPDMVTTNFTATLYDDTASAVATCTVTDARGVIATASVNIALTVYPAEGVPGGPIS